MFLCAAALALARAIPAIRHRFPRQLGHSQWSSCSTCNDPSVCAHRDNNTNRSNRNNTRDLRHVNINTYLSTRHGVLIFVTIFNLAVLAYGIWGVETLLIRNITGPTRDAESDWTFGQLSATILLVGPGFTFMRLLRWRFLGVSEGGVRGTDREGMPLAPPGSRPGMGERDVLGASASASMEKMDTKRR